MTVYIVFFVAMCAVLLWVAISGKEAFPFSAYPMYSGLHSPGKVNVIRIALQQQDGRLTWWKSRFYRYPEYTARKLQELHQAMKQDKQKEVFALLERNRLLHEVLRLIESEEGSIHRYQAFHIVERRGNEKLEIREQTLAVISFSELRHGKTP